MTTATLDDKKEYFRATLGDRPFSKEFIIFEDTPIRFRSLTVMESDIMRKYDSKLDDDSMILSLVRIFMYMDASEGIASTIKTMTVDEGIQVVTEEARKMSKERYTAYLAAYNQFIDLLVELRESILDKDFWQGAGAA